MFKELMFNKIGNTGDGNKYPLLVGNESGYKGVWVAVPVDDYDAITKHLDEVDEKLDRLEAGGGLDNYSVDEILGAIIPSPFDNFGLEMKDEIQQTRIIEAEIQPLLNVLNHQGKKYEWADELGKYNYDWAKPSYLSDEEILGMVKDIEYKVQVNDNNIIVETYMHTILYGKHREQRFLQKYHTGIKPIPLVEPPDRGIMLMEDKAIDAYVKEVKAWAQREKDIDEWSDYKIKVIGQAKDTIKVEIEGFIARKQMSVSRQNKQGHNLYWNYQDIEINPFAFWISPDDKIPSAYQYLIEEDEL